MCPYPIFEWQLAKELALVPDRPPARPSSPFWLDFGWGQMAQSAAVFSRVNPVIKLTDELTPFPAGIQVDGGREEKKREWESFWRVPIIRPYRQQRRRRSDAYRYASTALPPLSTLSLVCMLTDK